mmetsp:Transcript_19148/g.27245  ORF Transcript_19148/g.27245 Transcript_19148/m.27245 type:complete len:90 (-) Transcript_19148:1149-1418(-)
MCLDKITRWDSPKWIPSEPEILKTWQRSKTLPGLSKRKYIVPSVDTRCEPDGIHLHSLRLCLRNMTKNDCAWQRGGETLLDTSTMRRPW